MKEKIKYTGLSLLFIINLLLFSSQFQNISGQTAFDTGATVVSSVQIGLSEGMNQFGRKTIFQGGFIDFGSVTFTHPEQVASGDAYRDEGNLKLEAVMNVDIIFGGASSVSLELMKLRTSANPFNDTYYSLSTIRSDVAQQIYEEPRSNRIQTLTSSTTFPLRLILEIRPNQTGRLSDRFRLQATTL
ncbi:MAG: hypothetical protein IPJ69_11755 [Deltaproteobacteria bacterium]|nr:MAG: hypothetical protein IPJ69_11755 [Deltaproteobacteria bacterium]